jgi:GcrA cell cycle regulator
MPSRKQPWNWTKEEDERLRALVAQGASVVKAAAALKRKIVSVRTRARVLGCPFPPLRAVRQKWAETQDEA